ncbi:unnamed protein product [Symbiodinium sp. CCMP2592]|nr:unnamed protein product [Symbiodinium sp. CCMP2592]
MTPMPCGGAPTSLEMWPPGPILDDYRSFGEYYSPSERLSLKTGSSPLHQVASTGNPMQETQVELATVADVMQWISEWHGKVAECYARTEASRLPVLWWSSPPYWSLVEQISTLSKEKILLLNECSDLRSDNQAIRVDNEQLHEALRIQRRELEKVRRHMRNYKRRLAKDAKLRSGTADDQKPRLSDASLPSTCDSDGEQPPEEPAEASDEESLLSRKPFLNNDELVDLMHGGPWPAAASPRRYEQSIL